MTKSTKNAKSAAATKASPKTAAKQATATKRRAAANDSNATAITKVLNTQGGQYVLVEAGNGDNFLRSRNGDSKEFRTYAKVGLPYAAALKWNTANPAAKPTARLANGVAAKDAPHSAKAIADQNAKAAPKGKAAATGKNAKARAAKADKAKQPSKGTDRRYAKGDKKDESKPDTFRKYMLTTIMAHKSTADAKAAHAKSGKYPTHKLDFNWSAQQGYIKFVD